MRKTIPADAKAAKTVRGAKQGEADIVNIGKACDKAEHWSAEQGPRLRGCDRGSGERRRRAPSGSPPSVKETARRFSSAFVQGISGTGH